MLSLFLSMFVTNAVANPWPDLSKKVPTALKSGRSKDHALVIAVEDYVFVSDIPGAQQNGTDWYLWLTESQRIRPQNIQFLRDKKASRENVLDMAGKIGKKSKPGEKIWFVFVGHGAPSKDGKEGLLLGVDVQQDAKSIYARGVLQSEVLSHLEANDADVFAVVWPL